MPILATLLFGGTLMSSFGIPTVTPFSGGKKAAFSLEFDDAMDSQVENALPLLKKYRFAATFYINPGRNDYDAKVWEKDVPADGHELGNHTMHHKDTVGAELAAVEIGDASKVIQRAHGRVELVPFAQPGGVRWEIPKEDFERILRENHLFFPGRNDFSMDGQGDILRFPKLALEKREWRKLGFHGVGGQWLSTSIESLTSLLEFLDAHREEIWVAPTGAIWKYVHERDAVQKIDLRPNGEKGFTLLPQFDKTNLDPLTLYNVPLTVQVEVPSSWKEAWTNVAGRIRPVLIREGKAEVSLIPGTHSITVTNVKP